MAAVLLDASVIAAVKSALAKYYYDIKSSHLSEALASALGYRTNRSLQAALEKTKGIPRIAVLDGARFLSRLDDLGYPHLPDPQFDGEIGKDFGASDAEFGYPDEVLRCLGGEQMDLYYFCVMLQSSGGKLPGYLSFASIDSRMVKANLKRPDGFTYFNLADMARMSAAFESPDLEPTLPSVQAHDDYDGTVSFRADAPDDIEALFEILRTRFPGAWRRTDATGGEEVELAISGPLRIATLHDAMHEVEDGHIMVETLRALPLHLNNLERRYSAARPRDWASLDDEDLLDDDGETDGPAMR